MITLADYFKGQVHHESVEAGAGELIDRLNRLLVYLKKDCPDFKVTVTSGYRSPSHNKEVGGKAKSKHMSGQAIDLYDPNKVLAKWCVSNKDRLVEQMLWCEDPRATKNWVHFQSVPPGSGNRFFIPDAKSAPLCKGPLTVESL